MWQGLLLAEVDVTVACCNAPPNIGAYSGQQKSKLLARYGSLRSVEAFGHHGFVC